MMCIVSRETYCIPYDSSNHLFPVIHVYLSFSISFFISLGKRYTYYVFEIIMLAKRKGGSGITANTKPGLRGSQHVYSYTNFLLKPPETPVQS